MRTSEYYMPTLKESPAEAKLPSHKLMLRAGLIRKLASGLYSWLPLGFKILKKVETIIREEMSKIGSLELVMPLIQPSELWEETKRWDDYGPLLLRMEDRHGRAFCFAPTHEEVITDMVRHEIKSYKQLPKCFYQIQAKFRDEIRPRFGVMRAREFVMKDAYSFHLNEECMQKTYDKMYQAYNNIFTRLGLKFRPVLAETGEIGGKVSHEFHVLAESGEDTIAFSNESDYAANVELAKSIAPAQKNADKNNSEKIALDSLTITNTPNIQTVEKQAAHMGIPKSKILKTLLVQGAKKTNRVVALLLRGDTELNHFKAEKLDLIAKPLKLIDLHDILSIAKCKQGFVGPKDLNVPIVADELVLEMKNFSCGANVNDTHYLGVNWGRDIPKPKAVADLRLVQKGDLSPDGKGTLDLVKGVEVGHIFQLGDKYTSSMKVSVLDENGKSVRPLMGCYGIGVSRIIGAAIEQNHDDKGIIWPKPLAPFAVVIIPIDYHKSSDVKNNAVMLYDKLVSLGIDVLLDDRKERPGVMFKDMELIGVPNRVVISKKTIEERKFDYKQRESEESTLLDMDELIKTLTNIK